VNVTDPTFPVVSAHDVIRDSASYPIVCVRIPVTFPAASYAAAGAAHRFVVGSYGQFAELPGGGDEVGVVCGV
jgi:hypothetical protein